MPALTTIQDAHCLPEPVSSFGAAVLDNWLYVYSGHKGESHAHSKANLSRRFSRVNLASADSWETLPMQTGLQSVALLSHGGNLYRVGGLTAFNEPGKTEELESVTEFARFEPRLRQWTQLAPLPEGRSSHDATIVGDQLYVCGGWDLGKSRRWHCTSLSIDLKDPQAKWVELPVQPFKRRALALAAHDGKLYAIGGMTEDGGPSLDVHVFDLAKKTWSVGPSVPGKGMNGFGCSALALNGELYLSTLDGVVYRLADKGSVWTPVGKLEHPRFFHRLVPWGTSSLLAVGGASHTEGHLDSIERLEFKMNR